MAIEKSRAESTELNRIRAEYARRDRDIPEGFYNLLKPGNSFIYAQRTRAVNMALSEHRKLPLSTCDVLEIGCGEGDWLVDFETWGADQSRLAAIELDEHRLGRAIGRLPRADLRLGDASRLPWDDQSFDIVLQSTVFTSILNPKMKRAIASEMVRVLRPGGVILWYDFRYDNPRNPNVRGIEAREIRQLFAGCDVHLRKIVLAPPIARRLVKISWIACLLLEKIPLLRTFYLGVIQKRQD